VSNVNEESPEDCSDRVIPSWFENPEPPIDAGLVERAEYYSRRGVELLDAVPRDDPFWEKTNRKATVYKADLWFHQVLEANPEDAEARWILAAFKLVRCRTGLEALLAPLVLEDPSNLRWLVWRNGMGEVGVRRRLHSGVAPRTNHAQ
jgi:hypothetical protein